MRRNLYKSNLTGKIYFVLEYREIRNCIKLKLIQPPFTIRGMSTRNLEQYYTPIAEE